MHVVTAQVTVGGCKKIVNVVDCANLGLLDVPNFASDPTLRAARLRLINLENNNIQVVRAHAFNGVSSPEINLERNRITTIENGAFDSVYSNLTNLNLNDNKLREVPNELKNLNVLKSLNVKNNDFPDGTSLDHGITDNVFRELGDTLEVFEFGGRNIASWPQVALTHFPNLKTLKYGGGYLGYIPFDGFHGFEHTLQRLFITNTKLRQTPLAISQLTQLRELHFDDNIRVTDTGILSQAFATITHNTSPLQILSLQNDGLSRFPAVLRNLVNLKELYMSRNRMWYVADDAINLLINSSITTMGMSGCSLDRIPQSLLKLPTLEHLDLSKNNIQSIERFDMSNQTTMNVLNVSGNPLAYVSTEAFKAVPKLTILDFSSTHMIEIPQAIKNVVGLKKLILDNDLIECTCELTWIPNNQRTSIEYTGTCETIEQPIDDYVKTRVPTCPTRR